MPLSDQQPFGSTNGNRPLPPVETVEAEPAASVARHRYGLAVFLLLATAVTTLLAGAQLQNDFGRNPPFSFSEGVLPIGWILHSPSRLLLGVPFSLTLLLILLSHEMGHFVACRRYGVDCTPPYFIPVPWPLGTMGAFIRIRSPFPSRAALFDIGVAGPIAGFLVAVPALVLGLILSKVDPKLVSAAPTHVGYPAIFYLVRSALGVRAPIHDIYFHPIAVAAWVGMLATSLNLLPGSQLDGGHLLYALWPRAHRNLTRFLVVLLLPLGLFVWPGWLFWFAVLLIFGTDHPYVPEAPGLTPGRKWLALFALLMLALTFMPVPIQGPTLDWHKPVNAVRRLFR
jgi:membrane-associated protease RseP (regulator of RpoE activity)